MKTVNVIYVHGLGSTGNGRTARLLQNYLGNGFKVIAPTIPEDPAAALSLVKNEINKHDCRVAVGSSLGAFTVLRLRNIMKIVINPCIDPANELPKLGVSQEIASKYVNPRNALWNNIDVEEKAYTFGIFGINDELFSYRKTFSNHYPVCNIHTTDDKHRVSPTTIAKVIVPIIKEHFRENSLMNESVVDDIPRESLNERFETMFSKDREEKLKWLDQVWDVLNKSYSHIGGLHGINSKEELVDDCDLWKLVRRGNTVTTAYLYKTKRGGRKMCYCGQNGTEQGKKDFYMLAAEDVKLIDRLAWGEGDDKICHIFIDKLGAAPIPAEMVKWLFPDKKIEKFDPDGYHYYRMIGGHLDRKMMFGNLMNDPELRSRMATLPKD